MTIHKKGQAHWEGDIKRGKGTVSTESGVLNQQPYGFNTRFEGAKGTNPEELIGAAHAACFSMALSLMLGEAGFTPTSIDTTADVSLDKVDAGFAITKIALKSEVAVPGIDASTFDGIIQKAKAGCPVSQVLKAEITLDLNRIFILLIIPSAHKKSLLHQVVNLYFVQNISKYWVIYVFCLMVRIICAIVRLS